MHLLHSRIGNAIIVQAQHRGHIVGKKGEPSTGADR